MKGLYLLLDGLTILPPLAFSFHPRIAFYRCWPTFIPALGLVAVLFLIWDAWFTRLGIWGFNPAYLVGIYIGNLPLEECLFFVCIPYACVFTLFCWGRWCSTTYEPGTSSTLTWTLITLLFVLGVWKWNARYTAATLLSLSLLLLYLRLLRQDNWLGRFYTGWLILLVPLVLVDGILTGTGLSHPVVAYNASDIFGLRIATIPVEDFLYGMELVLLNIVVSSRLERRWARRGGGRAIGILQ